MVDHLRVLLVEDDLTTRQTLRALLGQCIRQARITEAGSGEEALAHMRRERFDLVVADYHMGFLDGIALLEIARRDHPEVGRILVTGHADFDVAREAINRAGVHAFLQKPVTAPVLARAIASTKERVEAEIGSSG